MRAFDNILTETPYTRQIQTLAIPGEENLITFWESRSKMTEKICQSNIQKKFKEQEMVLNQVCVKMMRIDWLQQEAHQFLDLVEILSEMND